MSSTVDNLTHNFNQLNFSTPHQSWLETTANQRSHGRTLRILSSDDEDDNGEEAGYSSEGSEDEVFVRRSTLYGDIMLSTPQIDKLKSKMPLPSDEEDEDDDDEEDEDDDENEAILPRPSIRPVTKGTSYGNGSASILPSESKHSFQKQRSDGGSTTTNSNNQSPSYFTLNEDFATNDDNDDNEVIGQHLRYPISSNFDAPPKSNAMHQFQQYQQQQMTLYQFSLQQQQHQQQHQQQYHNLYRNQQKHSPPQQHQQHQQPQQSQLRMATMSGMELLIQREQEKAEQKRQKPKMNPGKVKIVGLLGRLPEAGSHNINFQHVQQQHQLQQQQQQQQFMFGSTAPPTPNSKPYKSKRNRASGFNSNNLMAAVPQQQQQLASFGYSPSMYDYYTNGRSSVPPPPPTLYNQQQQAQSFYQSPTSLSNGNLYTLTNTSPYQQNRPGSTMNSSQIYKHNQRFSGNPHEYTI